MTGLSKLIFGRTHRIFGLPNKKAAGRPMNDAVLDYGRNFYVSTLARINLSFVPLLDMIERNQVRFRECASFGSGSCSHEAFLALMFNKSAISCFDKTDEYIPQYTKELIERLENLSFITYDFSHVVERKFDFVYSIQTLEHVEEYENALDMMCEAVAENGFIYVDTPQYHENPILETDIEERKATAWERHRHYHLGFSRIQMEGRLQDRGFDIVDSGYYCYRHFDELLLRDIRTEEAGKNRKADPDDQITMIQGFRKTLRDADAKYRDMWDEIDAVPLSRRVCMAIRILAKKSAS